jgi:hypothetical protein
MGHVRLKDSSFALNDVDLALGADGEVDGITTVSSQSLMVMSDVQLILL